MSNKKKPETAPKGTPSLLDDAHAAGAANVAQAPPPAQEEEAPPAQEETPVGPPFDTEPLATGGEEANPSAPVGVGSDGKEFPVAVQLIPEIRRRGPKAQFASKEEKKAWKKHIEALGLAAAVAKGEIEMPTKKIIVVLPQDLAAYYSEHLGAKWLGVMVKRVIASLGTVDEAAAREGSEEAAVEAPPAQEETPATEPAAV